jgi:hypothetical protein
LSSRGGFKTGPAAVERRHDTSPEHFDRLTGNCVMTPVASALRLLASDCTIKENFSKVEGGKRRETTILAASSSGRCASSRRHAGSASG